MNLDPMAGYDQFQSEQEERAEELRQEQLWTEAEAHIRRAWVNTDNGRRSTMRRVQLFMADLERGCERGPAHETERRIVTAYESVGLDGVLRLLGECVKAE